MGHSKVWFLDVVYHLSCFLAVMKEMDVDYHDIHLIEEVKGEWGKCKSLDEGAIDGISKES